MEYSLSSSLVGGSGSINPDGLSLDLQFAADKTLTARRGPTPAFTRGSTATFVGSNGLIQSAAINIPRFDHDISYAGSSVYVTSSDAIGESGFPLQSERVYFEYMDGNGYPVFSSDMYLISFLSGQWILDGNGGDFRAHSDFALSDEYVTDVGTGFGFVNVVLTLACKGLLIEEQRSNLLFPSEALTTQTRTVTAVAHTLSFYGTGTIALSGAHTATVTGTGAFPTRTTLTFTPSAGSLILTVTGSVTQAQLEAGSFATSYIPTVASSLTRSADVCSITGISSFYGGSGTLLVGSKLSPVSSLNGVCAFTQGSNQIMINRLANNTRGATFGASPTLTINSGTLVSTLFVKSALAFNTNDAAFANNGVISGTSSSVALPSVDTFRIGTNGGQNIQSGTISEIKFFRKRLPNAKLQSLTA